MDTSHRNNVPLCEDDDDLWYWGYSIFVPHIPDTRAYPYVSRIMGPDPKYRFARKFLQYQWPPKTPKGRRFDVELPGDGVYEVGIKRWNADKTLLLERRYTGCCCWMATSTPSPSGRCCRLWRHYAAVRSVPEKEPPREN